MTLVAELPRRTAHALYGLLESSRQLNMPVTAAEAMIYDMEAMTPRHTARGLRHARALGLCHYTGRYWTPSFAALELHRALENRYLDETMDETVDA